MTEYVECAAFRARATRTLDPMMCSRRSTAHSFGDDRCRAGRYGASATSTAHSAPLAVVPESGGQLAATAGRLIVEAAVVVAGC